MDKRVGDQSAFAALVEGHRRELRVHCYRMVGSFDDAEDLTQETFLRAWRGRASFEGRSSVRAWLYRIATNACLDFLQRHSRRTQPYQVPPAGGGDVSSRPPQVPWLQPYPEALLDPPASDEAEPGAAVVARETIELAFLVAIQHLPPRQRAVLILRDVLAWPAEETAAALEMSVAAVKSALQRARPALRAHLPARRQDWTVGAEPTVQESRQLRRYMAAMEAADAEALAELLSEEVRLTMPPLALWFTGRDAIAAFAAEVFDPASMPYVGSFKLLPLRANRQPAAAKYVLAPGESRYRAQSLDVLRVEDGRLVEITTFGVEVFAAFGLAEEIC